MSTEMKLKKDERGLNEDRTAIPPTFMFLLLLLVIE